MFTVFDTLTNSSTLYVCAPLHTTLYKVWCVALYTHTVSNLSSVLSLRSRFPAYTYSVVCVCAVHTVCTAPTFPLCAIHCVAVFRKQCIVDTFFRGKFKFDLFILRKFSSFTTLVVAVGNSFSCPLIR